jgi:predicted ATP-dependent serine protease
VSDEDRAEFERLQAETRARREHQAANGNEPVATPPPTRAPAAPGVIGAMLWEVAARERPPIRSYATGLPELDRLLGGGITTRQLLTLLGPPAAGKTAFAVDLASRLHAIVPIRGMDAKL